MWAPLENRELTFIPHGRSDDDPDVDAMVGWSSHALSLTPELASAAVMG